MKHFTAVAVPTSKRRPRAKVVNMPITADEAEFLQILMAEHAGEMHNKVVPEFDSMVGKLSAAADALPTPHCSLFK
jgi:hypothetical protein